MMAGAGFSMDEVNYGMTLRERNVLLVAIVRRELQTQHSFTQSVSMAIGSLFSKTGSKEIQKAIQRVDRDLEHAMEEALGLTEEQVIKEHRVTVAAAQARSVKKRPLTEKDMLRVIGKLDGLMTSLTGKTVRNPILNRPVE